MEREKISKGRMGKNRKGGDRDMEGEGKAEEMDRKKWNGRDERKGEDICRRIRRERRREGDRIRRREGMWLLGEKHW